MCGGIFFFLHLHLIFLLWSDMSNMIFMTHAQITLAMCVLDGPENFSYSILDFFNFRCCHILIAYSTWSTVVQINCFKAERPQQTLGTHFFFKYSNSKGQGWNIRPWKILPCFLCFFQGYMWGLSKFVRWVRLIVNTIDCQRYTWP